MEKINNNRRYFESVLAVAIALAIMISSSVGALEMNKGMGNLPPLISNENPAADSIDLPIMLSELRVLIEDPDGDIFDWSIETSPDIGRSSGRGGFNSTTAICTVSGLEYETTYSWYVNASDRGSGETSRAVYMFTTESVSDVWVIMVENSTAMAGETGLEILISGTWSEDIMGYSIALYYDQAKIQISDISLDGTIGEQYGWTLGGWGYDDQVPQAYCFAVAYTFFDPIPAGSGALFKIIVNISDCVSGNTLLDLDKDIGPLHRRCIFTDEFGVNIYARLIDGIIAIESTSLCGDVNGDNSVDLGDIIYLFHLLFDWSDDPVRCIGEVNGDGSINLADVAYLIHYLFLGGSAPVDNCCG